MAVTCIQVTAKERAEGAGDEDNRGVSSEERGHVDVSRMRLSICLFKK